MRQGEKRSLTFRWHGTAMPEWIARETWVANAAGQMVDHLTNSVLSASSRTRVLTFVPDASSVRWAIGVQHAFRSTSFVRITNVIFDTGTGTSSILFATYGVSAARRWRTRCRSLPDRFG